MIPVLNDWDLRKVIMAPKITQQQFVSDFKRDGNDVPVDVKNLDPATLEKLKKAGVTQGDLLKIAGPDKKINKDSEYIELFKKVDSFEKPNPSLGEFETRDANNNPTMSGEVYDALKLEVDRSLDLARAQGALKGSPAVPNKDSHAQHVAQVRSDLKKQGLPTSAKGVTVMVIGGENDPEHAKAVARTVSGPVGLAKDAEVRLQADGQHRSKFIASHRYTTEVKAKEARGSTANVNDLAKLGIAHLESEMDTATEQIRAAHNSLPRDGKTRIANVSWGLTPIGAVRRLQGIVPNEHPLMVRAGMEWAMQNHVRFDPNDSIHILMARDRLNNQIVAEMKTLQSEQANDISLKSKQALLQQEVNLARNKGMLIFNAAGNDRDVANTAVADPNASISAFDSIKGMITVGAANLGAPGNPNDDSMSKDSSAGKSIKIAAPGVDIPVGVENKKAAKKMSGTSFAAPYAASVAALMVAANPKITPDQIEAILTSGRVTTDLSGDTDGKGLLDPVKAVKEAKNLVIK